MTPNGLGRQLLQEAIGVIAEVHGPVAIIACRRLPPLRRALTAGNGDGRWTFEVHQHLDEQHVRAIALRASAGLRRGMAVYDSGGPLQIPVTPECLGRLLDLFGEPLDELPPLAAAKHLPIHGRPVALHEARGVAGVLETGIKVVDLLCPFVKGGKTGLFKIGRAHV